MINFEKKITTGDLSKDFKATFSFERRLSRKGRKAKEVGRTSGLVFSRCREDIFRLSINFPVYLKFHFSLQL